MLLLEIIWLLWSQKLFSLEFQKKILSLSLLTVGQNIFENKIPFLGPEFNYVDLFIVHALYSNITI